jgi:hypothetical protein
MTMTDFELSFQFPIKRDGASPVVLVASVTAGVSSGAADSVASGAADSVASGAAISLSLFELVITTAPTKRIPSSTANRTFADDLLLAPVAGVEEAAGLALIEEVRGAAGDGVVETFTRDLPTDGTGGITTFDATFLRAADFFTVFLAVDFLAADFLATLFFTTAFFAALLGALFFTALLGALFFTALLGALFFTALFLAGDFLAALFLAADFFGAAFLAADFFFTATVIS